MTRRAIPSPSHKSPAIQGISRLPGRFRRETEKSNEEKGRRGRRQESETRRYQSIGNAQPSQEGKLASLTVERADKQGEEENDGSGSLKQFREKMWSMAREEEEDPWVTYAWKYGDVRRLLLDPMVYNQLII